MIVARYEISQSHEISRRTTGKRKTGSGWRVAGRRR